MAERSAEMRQPMQSDPVVVLYTNWRGVTAVRRLVPASAIPFWWGESSYHKEPDGKPLEQWFFRAIDADREEDGARDYALSGVKAWGIDAVVAGSRIEPHA